MLVWTLGALELDVLLGRDAVRYSGRSQRNEWRRDPFDSRRLGTMNMRKFAMIVGVVLAAAVVYEEMRKKPGQARWHGKALGFVPYDLRLPALARFREAYWNPADPRVFTGVVCGIGWSVNFAAVADKVRRL